MVFSRKVMVHLEVTGMDSILYLDPLNKTNMISIVVKNQA